MIVVVTTEKHLYTHKSLASDPDVSAKVISYDELKANAARLPAGTYIFTDMDRLSPPRLMRAALYYRALKKHGQRVLNDPARVLSRFGLLRALNRAGINEFDAYRVEDLERPRRWPVFVRVEGGHGEPSQLLNNQKDLDAAIEQRLETGMPRSAMLIVEYAAEPVREGVFRKLSAFRVGDHILGYTCVHDDQWVVKYGKAEVATPDMYEEELGFVANSPFAAAMRPVFDIAGVEYGRIDFGLVGGKPQIYEINTNPDLKLRPKPGNVAVREQSIALFRKNFLAALAEIDTPKP